MVSGMERDFMGLNSKDAVVSVKEETFEGCKDTGAGQNIVDSTPGQQVHVGVPATTAQSVFASSCFNTRTNDTWFNSKAFEAPAQLTIFYAGTVKVYDGISPEKAQAIMLLAGNELSTTKGTQPELLSKHVAGDNTRPNHTVIPPSYGGLLSSISVSSHQISQTGGGSAHNNDVIVANMTSMPSASLRDVDPPKMTMMPLGPVSANNIIPSAVPQARKASLVQFLMKRKERAKNSSPYNFSKKTSEYDNPDSNNNSFSAISSVGSGLP